MVSNETRYEKLVNKLYMELNLPPSVVVPMLAKVEALATERTKALAKIREQAHRDYCRADHTFNKYWQEAWVAARDEVLEKHDNS
jgi:hypothetical protein